MAFFKRNPEIPTVYRAMGMDPGPDGRRVMYEFGDHPVQVSGPRDVEKFRNEEVEGIYRLIECDRLGNALAGARPDLNNPVPASFNAYTSRGNPVVAQAPVTPDPVRQPMTRVAPVAPPTTPKAALQAGTRRVAKKAQPQASLPSQAPVEAVRLQPGPAPTATPEGAGIPIDDDPEVRALLAQRGRTPSSGQAEE